MLVLVFTVRNIREKLNYREVQLNDEHETSYGWYFLNYYEYAYCYDVCFFSILGANCHEKHGKPRKCLQLF